MSISAPDQIHVIEEFKFEHRRTEDRVHFSLEVKAPGWVLVGFNDSKNIEQSYLVFGSIDGLGFHVEDHFVTSFGQHESLFDLGEGASLKDCMVKDVHGTKSLTFSLPINPTTKMAPDFKNQKAHYVWLAYSVDRDFNHHSRKRIGRWIKL